MPIVSLRVIPVGAGVNLSRYVAAVVNLLEHKGYRVHVTPDAVILQVDDVNMVGEILRLVHDQLHAMGVQRVISIAIVDDGCDVAEKAVEDIVKHIEEERARLRTEHGFM